MMHIKKQVTEVRLSKHVVPSRYHIKIRPDLENFTFEGQETITITLAKATKQITLHAKELAIEVVEVTHGEKQFFPLRTTYDVKKETVTFTFLNMIARGEVTLRITFRGMLNDSLRGFYRSEYHIDGTSHHMATTQFEATDARRAFPCFDEPAFKAIFDVELLVPSHLTAISNTIPIEESEVEAGFRAVRFAPTPKMSTYLLAFIIGHFEHIEAKTSDGVLVRVFTTPGKKQQAEFALSCATKMLSFYSKYFAIAYPLPILDLIAIPDFSAGAMENWGAITYRESMLLVDPKHSSARTKQVVASVIAHELAHQWFGNLVTMEWWTHLWLNEGFASYITYVAVDYAFPEWNIWTQFVSDDLSEALSLDALGTTHPIEVDVKHPDEISEIFDAVSYSKGASVIRMLAQYVGEEKFRDSLRLYLKKHSYANASTIHLWQAFERVTKKPIRKMMAVWTRKAGYPVVSVSRIGEKMRVTQTRFFANANTKKRARDNTRWFIPLFLQGKVGTQAKLTDTSGTFSLRSQGAIKINTGEAGFFRTAYASDLLLELIPEIERKKLSEADRFGLIRDASALAYTGALPLTDLLRLLSAYKWETSYPVWLEIAHALGELDLLLYGTTSYEAFRVFARGIFSEIVERVGWERKSADDHTRLLLRSLVLAQCGFYGDEKIHAHAQTLFARHTSGLHLDPDLRGAVYSLIALSGGEREFILLKSLYEKETLHEERNRIGRAMTRFTNETVIKKVLVFALSKQVRLQDSLQLVAPFFTNPAGRTLAWKFFTKEWKIFLKRYGSGGYGLARFVKAMGDFTTLEMYREVGHFFKTHPAPGASRAVTQVLERIEGNVLWKKRNDTRVHTLF